MKKCKITKGGGYPKDYEICVYPLMPKQLITLNLHPITNKDINREIRVLLQPIIRVLLQPIIENHPDTIMFHPSPFTVGITHSMHYIIFTELL